MTQLHRITEWMRDAGQSVDRENSTQASLYLGLCCEELAEGLDACAIDDNSELRELSRLLRTGVMSHMVQSARPDELLDAAIDLIWVATGLAASLGADVEGALGEVIRSNDSKRNPDGSMSLDATGKVIKGPNYTPPDLRPFLPKRPGPAPYHGIATHLREQEAP